MDEILGKIVSQSETSKLSSITSLSHQALEIICDKSCLIRVPMDEVRHKCIQVFKACLECHKETKLTQLAVNGLQIIVRQDIYWDVSCDEEEQQLPSQVIQCISSVIQALKEPSQLELLSILLQMICNKPSMIMIDNIRDIIEICCQLSAQSNQTNQLNDYYLGIEATASQSCHQFIKYCLNNCDNNSDYNDEEVVEEIITLFNVIINKLQVFNQNTNSIAVLLKCIYYIFITIPNDSHIINETLVDFIWQQIIPNIMTYLTATHLNDLVVTQASDAKNMGRGSQSVNNVDSIPLNKRHIFKITSELVRLFGQISCLRPALESLFHRILLYPPVSQRLDALKWMKELLKIPSFIINATFVEPVFGKSSRSKDLDLLHIVMDSLEECSLSSDIDISLMAISSLVAFLHSLSIICNTNGNNKYLSLHLIESINKMYPTLKLADFEGFDVRNTDVHQIDEYYECQPKVPINVLKTRIVGFDSNNIMTNNEDVCENDKQRDNEENNIRKELFAKTNIKQFKIEFFKSRLKEIMDSKSTDSYTESQTNENDNFEDNDSQENEISIKSKTIVNNDVDECTNRKKEITNKFIKMESLSTNYEEVREYQNSSSFSKTSCTEGPEFEECEDREPMITCDDDIHLQRSNARSFATTLKLYLPKLLTMRTSIEADHALQEFASNYCSELLDGHNGEIKNYSNTVIINSDGIYLSTYSTLLFNLKLIDSNFYSNMCQSIPLTEQEFIDDIHNSGILVYISGHWLAELYQIVLTDNLLENAGYKHNEYMNTALINLLKDIDGLDSCEPGAQQLSDYRRLERAVSCHSIPEKEAEINAAFKLVRRLVTAFWDTIVGCFGTAFRANCGSNELSNAIALNTLLVNDVKAITNKKNMITCSLDGLQTAAKLCIQLALQSRCDTIFQLLALSVIDTKCEINNEKNHTKVKHSFTKRSVIEVIKNRLPISLHTSHVLSLQVLLSCGLEMGSHCQSCWRYVFKSCQYIMELEHNYFTSRHSSLLSSTRTSISSFIKSSSKQTDPYLNFDTNVIPTSMPGINESEEINTETSINNLISETNDQLLKDKQLEKVIDILSHCLDLLFEDAVNKLNLQSLHGFLTELCLCSREQLSLISKTTSVASYSGKSLLLFRLSDVILRCAKSGRPVLHFMKCWSVVATHLTEAASHCDPFVAKKSISTLHDIINVFLSVHNELPHFHFNEALFKPFENLLLLEMVDLDIQELIISSICEFVEGTTEDIRSGWRPLFGALRGIRLPQVVPYSVNCLEQETERVRQLRVILDIFEAFLHTNNLQVLANAVVDCLLCLLKLIKTPLHFVNQLDLTIGENRTETTDLCIISLKYLNQLSSMLCSMYQMPACPLFASHKLLDTKRLIDTTNLELNQELDSNITLDMIDRPNKILHIWFLLIDEMFQAIQKCQPKHQKTAIEMIFYWFNNLVDIPGPNFAIYCANHIMIPTLQTITHETLTTDSVEDNSSLKEYRLSALRHLYGLTADLIVHNIKALKSKDNDNIVDLDLMLKQSLLVYIETLNGKYHESIAKLSCACIRHILLSVYDNFDNNLWQITIDCLTIAHKMTLQSLEALLNIFNNKSEKFFEDLDQIQVICKRNSCEDNQQLCRLAQQIFLLDAQRKQTISSESNKWSSVDANDFSTIPDNRSFIFLINAEDKPLTITYRVLVIQLTSHWLILQTMASLLLIGIRPVMANIDQLIDSIDGSPKPSVLSMDIKQCRDLLRLLDHTYSISLNFDSKPGLKFLIQKISRCDVPSNLYKFSSLVWSVHLMVDIFFSNDKEFCQHLGQSLLELSETYAQRVKPNIKKRVTIDDICCQPLYLLQQSKEELQSIIASFKTNNMFRELSEEVICEENHSDDTKTDISEFVNNNSDVKLYSLVTETKMDSMMTEYKKYKSHHSPIPQNVSETIESKKYVFNCKHKSNEDIDNNDNESQQFILKDTQAFNELWSQVISNAIDLHLSLPLPQFKQLIVAFEPSIKLLVQFSEDNQLKGRISEWISKLVDIICDKNQ